MSIPIEIFGAIAVAIISALVTAFIIGWKNRTDARLLKLENNYVAEFKSVRDAIAVLGKDMRDYLDDRFVTKELCRSLHIGELTKVLD